MDLPLPAPENRRTYGLALLLAAAVFLLYMPATGFDFINLDDIAYIFDSGMAAFGFSLEGAKIAVHQFTQEYWSPLSRLSYLVDLGLFGPEPFGFHLINNFLFALNGFLLFLFLHRVTKNHALSLAVAAVYLFHPLRVESVAWVAQRKELLAGAMFYGTLLCYLNYVEKKDQTWFSASVAFLIVGLLSKPTLVVTPVLLLLLDYWPLGRLPDFLERERFKELLKEKLPFFLVAAISVIATYASQADSVKVLYQYPVLNTLFNAFKILVAHYPLETLYPYDLVLVGTTEFKIAGFAEGLGYVAVFALLFWLAASKRKKYPSLLFAFLWYVTCLMPFTGFFPSGFQLVSNRFTFLAHIGLFLGLGFFLNGLVGSTGKAKKALAVFSAALALILAGLTYRQLFFWENTVTLFEHVRKVTDGHSYAHFMLGMDHFKKKDFPAAQAEFQLALDKEPGWPAYNYFMARTYVNMGDFDKAARFYYHAAIMAPWNMEWRIEYGMALIQIGDFKSAANIFLEILNHEPDNLVAINNAALAHKEMGQLELAETEFRRGLDLNPFNPMLNYNFGILLAETGRREEALYRLRETLKSEPDHRGALVWLNRLGANR